MRATNIHATCIVLSGGPFEVPDGTGVLLLGASGAGKSDLALRLIAAGAILVSDDRTDLLLEDGTLMAAPPAPLAGLIEVRNVGILSLPHCASARVGLVVELQPREMLERLPERDHWVPPQGFELVESARPALIRLNGLEASAPAKIAIAAAASARGCLAAAIAQA